MHPRPLHCSSLAYQRYARSSRLADGSPTGQVTHKAMANPSTVTVTITRSQRWPA